jgi:hypothetical protein
MPSAFDGDEKITTGSAGGASLYASLSEESSVGGGEMWGA